ERRGRNAPRSRMRDADSGYVQRRSACAVTEYYGGFPVRNVNVEVVPIGERKGVLSGRTFIVDQTPMIRVGLSKFATDSSLRDDWVMTHEMVHLAFPSVPDEHHWIEEGIATYVEPIARAQVSDLSPEKVWRDLVDDVHSAGGVGGIVAISWIYLLSGAEIM